LRDEAAGKRLRLLDTAAGLAFRTLTPLNDNEDPAAIHQQAGGRSGSCTGLTAVRWADGTVLTTVVEVKEEVGDLLQGPFPGQARGLQF
jgi:hypothetical protein